MAKKQEPQVGLTPYQGGYQQGGYPNYPGGYPQGGYQPNGYPQGGYPNGYSQGGFQQQQPMQPTPPPAPTEKEKKPEVKTKIKYLPRSFLWNIVGLCLAFFMGMFACFGVLVGVLAIVSKKATVKQTFSFVGANPEQYISEAYLDQSVLDLAGDLMNDARNKQLTNFDAVAKYSPLVRTAVDKVAQQLADMGVKLNADEFMGVEFSSLGSYMTDNVILATVLGDVLKLTPESSKLMLNVCYGTEGEDYTVAEGQIVMKEGKSATTIKDLSENAEGVIGRIEIGTALSVTASSEAAMRYLAYGSEGTDYDITDGKIVMRAGKKPRTISSLTDGDADIVGGAKVRDLVTLDDNSSEFMKAVADWKISDLTNSYKIKRLKIGQIVPIENAASPFLKAMRDWRVEEMTDGNKLDTVTLGELITVSTSSPEIVKALQDTSLCDLSKKVETLRLASVLGESTMSSNKLLKNLKGSTLKSLADDIASLTVEDVFGSDIYSYLSLPASSNKTYNQLLNDYTSTGRTNETSSANRPTPIPDSAVVTKKYVSKSNPGMIMTEGYYLQKAANSYVRVEESAVYSKGSGWATLVKTAVTPVYEWKQVDYTAGGLAPIEAGATISEESSGFLYTIGSNMYRIKEDAYGSYIEKDTGRVDLEQSIVGYKLDSKTYTPAKGQITLDDGKTYTIYTNETGSYIEQEQTVTKRYAMPDGNTKTASDVVVQYTASWTDDTVHTDEKVDRYLDGIWYLVFSSSATGAAIPLQDVATYVTQAQTTLTSTPLWKLYFHGIIDENPYRNLSTKPITGATKNNLNEYTFNELIELLKNIP